MMKNTKANTKTRAAKRPVETLNSYIARNYAQRYHGDAEALVEELTAEYYRTVATPRQRAAWKRQQSIVAKARAEIAEHFEASCEHWRKTEAKNILAAYTPEVRAMVDKVAKQCGITALEVVQHYADPDNEALRYFDPLFATASSALRIAAEAKENRLTDADYDKLIAQKTYGRTVEVLGERIRLDVFDLARLAKRTARTGETLEEIAKAEINRFAARYFKAHAA